MPPPLLMYLLLFIKIPVVPLTSVSGRFYYLFFIAYIVYCMYMVDEMDKSYERLFKARKMGLIILYFGLLMQN